MRRPVYSLFVCASIHTYTLTHTHSHTHPNSHTHSLTLTLTLLCRPATLVLGYGCLIAVNMASGLGVFGPSNAVISHAYPTAITPSGYALRQPQNGFVAGLHCCRCFPNLLSSSSREEDSDASSSSDPLPYAFGIWWDIALSAFSLSQGSFGGISVSPSLLHSLPPYFPSITPSIFVSI
jgi:hypothetical protein